SSLRIILQPFISSTQPLLDCIDRNPAQLPADFLDVDNASPDIVNVAPVNVGRLDVRAGYFDYRTRELVYSDLASGAYIVNLSVCFWTGSGQQRRLNNVIYVSKVTGLLPITVNTRRFTLHCRFKEFRYDSAIRIVGPLSGSINI